MSEASTILMLLRLNQDINTDIVDELAEKYTQVGSLFQAGSYVEALTLYEEILQRGNDLLQPVSSSASSVFNEPGTSTLPLTGSLRCLMSPLHRPACKRNYTFPLQPTKNFHTNFALHV